VTLPERGPWPHPYYETESATRIVSFRDTEDREWSVRVHEKRRGSGRPLVLVHGLMTSSYSWRYVLDGLGQRYSLFVPDLVGAGATEKPTDLAYTVANVGRFIAAYVKSLGLSEAPYIVGNSLGGLHGAKAIHDAPTIARRFLLMHSPGYPMLKARLGLPLLALAKRPVRFLLRRFPRLVVANNVHYERKDMLSQEEVAEYAKLFESDAGCIAFTRILRESLDAREHAEIMAAIRSRKPFPCPALCVFARKDAMVPPEFGPRWAEDLGAPLHWVEDASHFVHVDRPDKAIEEITGFDS